MLHKRLNVLWEVIMVYGPANHSLSSLLLDELSSKIDSCTLPLRIGGDFNLLRSPIDKSNSTFSWPLTDSFNEFIHDCTLCEIPEGGCTFYLI